MSILLSLECPQTPSSLARTPTPIGCLVFKERLIEKAGGLLLTAGCISISEAR